MQIADQGTQPVFVITYAVYVAHGLSLGPEKSAFLYMQASAQSLFCLLIFSSGYQVRLVWGLLVAVHFESNTL